VAFDARGLLHQEARLKADIRVTTLPEGMDPDEVVARDPQEWQQLVEGANPVVCMLWKLWRPGVIFQTPK